MDLVRIPSLATSTRSKINTNEDLSIKKPPDPKGRAV